MYNVTEFSILYIDVAMITVLPEKFLILYRYVDMFHTYMIFS